MGSKSYNVNTIFKNRPGLMDYPSLTPEVKEVVDYTIEHSLKANPVIRLKARRLSTKEVHPKQMNFWDLSWSDIILIRDAIEKKEIFEIFKIVYNLTEIEFVRMDLFNAFASYKWITNQLREISEVEAERLASEYDEEEKAAGAEEMQEFGYSVILDSLAGGDLLKYSKYLKINYTKIFRKMLMEKTRYEINKQMRQNASRKSQTNS